MYRITYIHKNQTIENDLYIPADRDYCLVSADLKVGMGISGELKIEIPDVNPAKTQIDCLTDEVIVYRNDKEIWRGRPITLQIDFNLTGKLTCEGILSYLYDTFYPPFEFEGSPNDLLQAVIDNHNSQVEERKQFQLGEITVEDNNDYINRSSINYNRTITILQEKFVGDSLGGYFRVRVENGVRYLDYLVAYNTESEQPVQYGYNLLDIAQTVSYSDVASVLLPLGAKQTDEDGMETDERLTIADVNGGSIYIVDQQAVNTYGWIVATNTWDDVTLPENLLTKGETYLEQITAPISQFEIKAVDLSLADPEIDPINLGDFVRIRVEAFDVDQYVELTEMDIDLLDVKNSKLTFGTDASTLTGTTSSTQRSIQESMGSLSMRVTNLTTNVLNAVYGNIEHLITETITTQYIQAAVADLGYVTADWIEARYIDADYIEANFASIFQLEAVSGNITELNSDLANIKNVLAGNVGTGDLQTVVLTAENAVIEEAVIVNALMDTVLASVLSAGIIYTDYIKIANNESQSLWIDGGTIQFKDADGTVREQLGVDASGIYNNYIWDEEGNLIWNALGLTEEGLTGNGAIIKDAAVADDANISGYKLNIDEVTTILNENGDLILDAAQVTIDGNTLDYHLTQITESIEGITAEGITSIENYYCLGTEDAPYYDVWGDAGNSTLGSMILGLAKLGENGNGWTTVQPESSEDEWVWFAQKAYYIDGHIEWTEPVLLSDYYAHKHLGVLQTEFTVVQGQIEAKVWDDDIKTAVDEATGQLTTVITEQYGDLTVTIDSITAEVGQLQTTIGEDFEAMYSYVSGITVDLDGIKEEVRETNQVIADNYSELSEKYAQVLIDTDSIKSDVANVWTELEGNYSTTRETQALIDQMVDEKSAEILQEVSYTYATKEEASNIDILGCETFEKAFAEIRLPDGWDYYNLDNGTVSFNWLDTFGEEYPYCVGFEQSEDSSSKRCGIQYLLEPLTAGTYKLKFKAATNAGSEDIARVSYGLNDAYMITTAGYLKSDKWTDYEYDFEVDEDVDSAYLVFRTGGSAGYTIYVTAIQLIATGKQLSRAIISSVATLRQYADDKMAEALLQVSYTYADIETVSGLYEYVDAQKAETLLQASYEAALTIDILGLETFAHFAKYRNGWTDYNPSYGYIAAGSGFKLQNSDYNTCAVISQSEDDDSKRCGIQYLIEPLIAGTYTLKFKAATYSGGEDTARVSYGLNGAYMITAAGRLKSDEWTDIEYEFEVEEDADSAYLVIRTGGSSGYTIIFTEVQLITTGRQVSGAITSSNATLRQYADSKMADTLLQVSYTYATQDELSTNTASLYEYVDKTIANMTLSVTNGSLGSSATIKLSAGGSSSSINLDLQNIREHFAEENSYVAISAGQIQFVSNTITIESTYFSVSSTGVITATSGTIGGWSIGTKSLYNNTNSMTSTSNGTYIGTDGIRQYNNGNYLTIDSTTIENGNSDNTSVSLTEGQLRFKNDGLNLGYFGTSNWDGTTNFGLNINTEYRNYFTVFGHKTSSSADMYTADYLINYRLSTSLIDYSQKHIFYGTGCFTGALTCYEGCYVNSNCYFGNWNSGSDMGFRGGDIFTYDKCALWVGNYTWTGRTYLLGVNGNAYADGDWYSGSDVSLKSNIKQLDINTNDSLIDAIEPVQYTYKDDTEEKVHFGVTYQNICEALEEAGLDPDSYAIVSKAKRKQGHPDSDDTEAVTLEADEGEEIGAVAYTELIGPMITEIQKLRKRVAQLEQAL